MSTNPRILSVRELFDGHWHFRVPVYQRAYAWGREEIETLVRDIASAQHRKAYYVGSLVLHQVRGTEDSQVYDVIDGQQRLTTFFLLLSHPSLRQPLADQGFHFPGPILSFEERSRSTSDLAQLARGVPNPRLADEGIAAAVATIDGLLGTEKRLQRIMGEQDPTVRTEQDPPEQPGREPWLKFLLDHVKITVSELPRETDLNHYFEVMNTRGVQLEKHEVVKAHLIGLLGDDDRARAVLNRVWDAASDFTRPIQAGFSADERGRLFGPPTQGIEDGDEGMDRQKGWAVLQPATADELFNNPTAAEPESPSRDLDLDDILEGTVTAAKVSAPTQTSEDEGRYGAIIDFPNFLLHVLRLQFGDSEATDSKVTLDDKQLVAQFDQFVMSKEHCLKFTHRLLRTKYLFDNYVIKTRQDPSTSSGIRWVLHRFHSTGRASTFKLSPLNAFPDNQVQQRILMVQAMYQVTQSRRVYKQFLYSILEFLDKQWETRSVIDGVTFLDHLHSMAEASLGSLKNQEEWLNTGTGVPHLALNLLDYKLWLSAQPDSDFKVETCSKNLPEVATAVDSFHFAYRTSIEHFLAVNFAEGGEKEVVDHFGNLCLMTRVENSRRSDHDPAWKARKYGHTDQSLKFAYMAALREARNAWGVAEINEQGEAMRKILNTPLPRSAYV